MVGDSTPTVLVATQCPIVKDDAPEFTVDVPLTRLGDKWPAAASCEAFDYLGECVGKVDAESCRGKLTVICAFDRQCCICKRFALPWLQRLWVQNQGNPQCAVVAIGRECDAAALLQFREECREAVRAGDRHIVDLSFPMAPDADRAVFHCLAEAIVPRFYLLGPDGEILYQQAGFDDEALSTLQYCLDQELTYL
mmetsp:Transcript_98406/g.278292  ORF Transcript_98406/g.278292 Transcript_98406/m.278292 type:complete len:195 (-) Transcript_98406:56-640(-)